ncbi:MAG: DUF3786 domain-containing protein [Chloroflexota bacterium]
MSKPDESPHLPKPGLALRVDELRAALRLAPVDLLVERTGSTFHALDSGRGEFRLSLFDSPLTVSFPGLVAYQKNGDPFPPHIQALIIYYFHTADGAPLAREWVSFADLPDGRIYDPAFQGYSGNEVVKAFGLDVERFRHACEKAGGRPENFGDAAYVFQALPRLPLLVNFWFGDEDFPSTCKILFDRSLSHYLPTDVAAILGGMLARRLARSAA